MKLDFNGGIYKFITYKFYFLPKSFKMLKLYKVSHLKI